MKLCGRDPLLPCRAIDTPGTTATAKRNVYEMLKWFVGSILEFSYSDVRLQICVADAWGLLHFLILVTSIQCVRERRASRYAVRSDPVR